MACLSMLVSQYTLHRLLRTVAVREATLLWQSRSNMMDSQTRSSVLRKLIVTKPDLAVDVATRAC